MPKPKTRKHQAQLEELAKSAAVGEVFSDEGSLTYDSFMELEGDLPDDVIVYYVYENLGLDEVQQKLEDQKSNTLYLLEQAYDLALS